MRLYLILLLAINSLAMGYAQTCPPLNGKYIDHRRFHVSGGYGITKIYGDANANEALGSSGFLKLDYSPMRGFYLGVEAQKGTLNLEIKSTANPKQSENDYFAIGLGATVHPFMYILRPSYLFNYSRYILESLYVGLSAFHVNNNYDYVYRNQNDPETYGPISSTTASGEYIFEDQTTSFVFPTVNLGGAFPLNNLKGNGAPSLSLVANAQFNFGQNDELDGYIPYDVNGRLLGGSNDFYSFYSLGLRYSF